MPVSRLSLPSLVVNEGEEFLILEGVDKFIENDPLLSLLVSLLVFYHLIVFGEWQVFQDELIILRFVEQGNVVDDCLVID